VITIEQAQEIKPAPPDLKGRAWLEDHLENFVNTFLGAIPTINPDLQPIKEYWSETRIKCLVAVWRKFLTMTEGKKILLPGRDAWEFEVLARLDGTPTVFRKDASTCGARLILDYKTCGNEYIALDSGYRGSVAKTLGVESFKLVAFGCGPLTDAEQLKLRLQHQVFPHYKQGKLDPKAAHPANPYLIEPSPIRKLVTSLECSPKYWERATLVAAQGGKSVIQQGLSQPDKFSSAAQIVQKISEWYLRRL
jgi:hypothetical protein